MKGQYLTHVASVRVCAPPDRDDLQCFIYGEISFNVGHSDDPVTLYSRRRDNPDFLYLEHFREGRNLTLSDDHKSHRALAAVSPDNPLHVKMKLYEKKGSHEEDVLIASLHHCDSGCEPDSGRHFVFPGDSGFNFEVCYSVVFGALVEVEAKVTEGEGNSMWAQLSAYQFLGKKLPPISTYRSVVESELYPYRSSIPDEGQRVGETITSLVTIYEKLPVTLNVGERIDLKRRLVVAPMRRRRYLSIALAAVMGDEDVAEEHEVYFPLEIACQRSHVRLMKFANGIVFSVSIKFVDPALVL